MPVTRGKETQDDSRVMSHDAPAIDLDDEFERDWCMTIMQGVRDVERARALAEDARRGLPEHAKDTEPNEQHFETWLNDVSDSSSRSPSAFASSSDEFGPDDDPQRSSWRDKFLTLSEEKKPQALKEAVQHGLSINAAELVAEPRRSGLSTRGPPPYRQKLSQSRQSRKTSYKSSRAVMAPSSP